MRKNQKGITMVMLVVTIIVLLILAGITISTSTDLLRSSKIKNYITIMSLVKVEVEKIYEDFSFENDVSDISASKVSSGEVDVSKLKITNDDSAAEQINIEDKISNMSPEEKGKLVFELPGIDVRNLWYQWGKDTLQALKLDYTNMLEDGECFYVNYATGEVIYSKGYTDKDGQTTYSLTGLLNL